MTIHVVSPVRSCYAAADFTRDPALRNPMFPWQGAKRPEPVILSHRPPPP